MSYIAGIIDFPKNIILYFLRKINIAFRDAVFFFFFFSTHTREARQELLPDVEYSPEIYIIKEGVERMRDVRQG